MALVSTVLASIPLASPAFVQGGPIPILHTCDGADLSPPLRWTAGPAGTRTWAVIVDDPDAPGRTWLHWTAWNLSSTTLELREGIMPGDPAVVQGKNDFGRTGWGGPCPPKGHGPHRYFFRIYALDTALSLAAGAARAQLDAAMAGHVLGQGELMGTYERK